MVQRKHKKPKDLLVLADEGLPGAAQARRVDGSAFGGGVRRPALAPLPNYMRPTTCSGAKVGVASLKEAEAPPPTTRRRGQVEVAGAPPHAGRATCSSTLKEGAPRGEAHVCSYAYCSLKGHVRAPPLRTFVASRRRLVRTQHSMKLKGASPFRKPTTNSNNQGGGAEGYFLEVHDAAAPLSSAEEMVEHDYCLSCGDDKAKDYSVGDSCGSSVVVSDGSIDLLGSTENRGRIATHCCDHEDDDYYFGACKSDISDERNLPEDVGGDQYYAPKECSSDGISSALSGISFVDVTSSECADAATSQRNKLHVSGRRRTTSEEGSKQARPFKPRPPNFLPVVEKGPEADKVDLRHQAANDPRDAEEWMVDYALRKAVKKLARAQKRKVEMLVQAFETVLPTVASDKQPVQHDDDRNSFALPRPSQACS